MSESIEELQKKIRISQSKIEVLEKILASYETNGTAKLFYALNRKAYEMADLLNATELSKLDLSSKDDKTFERLKVVWNDAASIAIAVKSLGDTAGITNNEDLDTSKSVYRKVTTPESMADAIGELAGNKKR